MVKVSSASLENHSPRKIPMREFFRNPETTGYAISPNGNWLAFTKTWENRMNIFVQATRGPAHSERRLTSVRERDVGEFFWKSEDMVLYSRDFGGDENYHIYAVDVESGRETDLTPFPGVRATLLDALLESDRNRILVSHNQRSPRLFDVHAIDVRTGESQMVAENPGNVTDWTVDHAGVVRIACQVEGTTFHILHRNDANSPWHRIVSHNYRESFTVLFFAFDNKNFYALSTIKRDRAAVVEIDSETGMEVRIVYQTPDYDMGGLSFSRARQRLTKAEWIGWKPEVAFFDPQSESMHRSIAEALPGMAIALVNSTLAEDRHVIRASSDRAAADFYLYDVTSDELRILARSRPDLDAADLSPMRPIEYFARDGLRIHGYLTTPAGRPPCNLPMVVMPHGGPWARDTWRFRPDVQFLANRGYAVLQMNFRGSTGYGRKFLEASFKQWGRAMQDDVSDGVAWAVGQGIADPARIAIFGASYGGYAALAGLTFTPELYACGIDFVGVSNLLTFMYTMPPYWEHIRTSLYEMVGNPETEREMLMAASPFFHADRIRAPLLVAQGARDPRVNQAESDQIVGALRARGIEVEYLLKENEGHGFMNEENRFEFFEAMERFLARHLG